MEMLYQELLRKGIRMPYFPSMKFSGIKTAMTSPLATIFPLAERVSITVTFRPFTSLIVPRTSRTVSMGVGARKSTFNEAVTNLKGGMFPSPCLLPCTLQPPRKRFHDNREGMPPVPRIRIPENHPCDRSEGENDKRFLPHPSNSLIAAHLCSTFRSRSNGQNHPDSNLERLSQP